MKSRVEKEEQRRNENIKSGWRTVKNRMRMIAGGHTDQFTFGDIKQARMMRVQRTQLNVEKYDRFSL
jgi:hypothetical protein